LGLEVEGYFKRSFRTILLLVDKIETNLTCVGLNSAHVGD